MTFSNTPVTGQLDYNRYFFPSLPGRLSGMGSYAALPYLNDIGTADTYTITAPASPVADTEYFISVNGNKAVFKADASPTQAEVAEGIFNAIRFAPKVYRLANVTRSGNVITLTAQIIGSKLTVSAPNFTVVNGTQPSASTAPIPFGRFVGRKSTYRLDQRQACGQASLIDAASGYEVLGITMASAAVEKQGIGPDAVAGYSFGDTMSVLMDAGTYKGIWVECVEPDLVIGDLAYIAVSAGNEGKLTKATSGTVNISTNARIMSGSELTFGNTYMALVHYRR